MFAMSLPAATFMGIIIILIPLVGFLIGCAVGLIKRFLRWLCENRKLQNKRKYPYKWLLVLSIIFSISTFLLPSIFYVHSPLFLIISFTLWVFTFNPFRGWLMRPKLSWPIFIIGLLFVIYAILRFYYRSSKYNLCRYNPLDTQMYVVSLIGVWSIIIALVSFGKQELKYCAHIYIASNN